jgi:hypothetical protein
VIDLIEALHCAGYAVSFASAAEKGPYRADLRNLGVTEHAIAVNDSGFDHWIRELSPNVVIFDRFMTEEQFGWRVELACPQALRILETSDLHCLRDARAESVKTNAPANLKNAVALREIASILRCDGTLIISEVEMEILQSEFGIDPELLLYWPFLIDAPDVQQFNSYEKRKHCILIGSFLHAPNLDAARWCRDMIWPKIRKELPETELHIYGSYGDKYASELNAPKQGILYKGRAEDALETMAQYRVNLAPLRFGAGLKGKVFDGFLTGTPTVCSLIGAEGITGALGWGCTISEDPDLFAQAAVATYQTVAVWTEVQTAGQAILKERFLREVWQPKLGAWLSAVASDLEGRRQRNFTGQMLRHHHHRSTEYMSRWIEAKNRKAD